MATGQAFRIIAGWPCLGLAALLLAGLVGHAAAQVEKAGVRLPATLELNGLPLQLASCGVRETLWVNHYVRRFMSPGPMRRPASSPIRPRRS